jgi:autotransporter translocation and assembly factor TamB
VPAHSEAGASTSERAHELAQPPDGPGRGRRWLRRLGRISALLALLAAALLAALHLPPVERAMARYALRLAGGALGLELQAEHSGYNLLALSVELDGVRGTAAGTDQLVLSASRLHAAVPLSSLVGTPRIELTLASAELWLEQREDGTWNLPALDGSDEPSEPGPVRLPELDLSRVRIDGLRLHLRRPGLSIEAGPLQLDAQLRLPSLAGRAELHTGPVLLRAGDSPVLLDSASVVANGAGGRVTARLEARGPGARVESDLALARPLELAGLSGRVEAELHAPELPEGLLPGGMTGRVSLAGELGGSLTRPELRPQLEATGLGLPSAGVTVGTLQLGGRMLFPELSGELQLFAGNVDYVAGGRRYPLTTLKSGAVLRRGALSMTLEALGPGAQLGGQVALSELSTSGRLSGKLSIDAMASQLPAGVLPTPMLGEVHIDLELGGTLGKPVYEGELSTRGLRLPEPAPRRRGDRASLGTDLALLRGGGDVPPEGDRLPTELDLLDALSLALRQALAQTLRPEIRLRFRGEGAALTIEELQIGEGETTLQASGRFAPGEDLSLELDLNIPELGRYEPILGAGISGALRVRGSLSGTPEQPGGALRFELREVRYAESRLDGEGSLDLGEGRLRIERLAIETKDLRATLSGGVDVEGLLRGERRASGTVRVATLRVGDEQLGPLPLDFTLAGDRLGFEARVLQGAARASGSYGLAERRLVADVAADELELRRLRPFLPAEYADLAGSASLTAKVQLQLPLREGATAQAQADVQVRSLRAETRGQTLAIAQPTRIRLDADGTLRLEATRLDLGAAGSVRVDGSLALGSGPMDARIEGQLALGRLAAFLGIEGLEGQAEADLRLGGTLQRPELEGLLVVRALRAPGLAADLARVELRTERDGRGPPRIAGEAELRGVVADGRPLGRVTASFEAAPPPGRELLLSATALGRQVRAEARLRDGRLAGAILFEALDAAPWLGPLLPAGWQAEGHLTGRLDFEAAELSTKALRGKLTLTALQGRAGQIPFSLARSPQTLALGPDLRLSTDGLELDLGGSDRITLRGELALSAGRGVATAGLTLDLAKLRGLLPETIEGRLEATAQISEAGIAGRADLLGLAVAGQSLGTSELRFVLPAEGEPRIDASLLGGQLLVEGRRSAAGFAGTTRFAAMSLGPWLALAAPPGVPSSGTLSGRLELAGPELTARAMRGTLTIETLHGRLGDLSFALGAPPLRASLAPGLRLAFAEPGLLLDLGGGDLFSLVGTLDLDALRGEGRARLALDLSKLDPLVQGSLQGRIEADGRVFAAAAVAPLGGDPAIEAVRFAGSVRMDGVTLEPWLPPADDETMLRTATLRAELDLSGTGLTARELSGTIRLQELDVRGGPAALRLAAPTTLELGGHDFRIAPTRLVLGDEELLTLEASGTFAPLIVQLRAGGVLDLGRLGELLGVRDAAGRITFQAAGQVAESLTDEGTGRVRFPGDGIHLQAQLSDAVLGPWIEYLRLAPGVRQPTALVNGELDLRIRGLRPEDVTGTLRIERIEMRMGDLQASTARPFAVRYDGEALRIETMSISLGGGDRLALDGTIVPSTGALALRVEGQLDIARLGPWLGIALDGTVTADLALGGTVSAPVPTGTLSAAGLRIGDLGVESLQASLTGAGPELRPLAEMPIVTGSFEARGVAYRSLAAAAVGLSLEGTLQPPALTGALDVRGLSSQQQRLGDVAGTLRVAADAAELDVSGLEAALGARVRWPFEAGAEGSVELTLRQFPLGPWLRLALPATQSPPDGLLTGTAQLRFTAPGAADLSGPVRTEQLVLDFGGLRMRLREPAQHELREGVLHLQPTTLAWERTRTSAATTPEDDGALLLSGTLAPASLALVLDGVLPLGSLLPLVPSLAEMEGAVPLQLRIGGTLDAPLLDGSGQVQGARIVYADPRLEVQDLTGTLAFEGNVIQLQARGLVGEGLVSVQGRITIGERLELEADLTITTLGARLDLDEYNVVTIADANLSYRGPLSAGLLQGEVRLVETRYRPRISPLDILSLVTTRTRTIEPIAIDPTLFGESEAVLQAEPRLNLSLTAAPGTIEVDSDRVKATARLELQVLGTPTLPGILGQVEVSDGSVDIYRSRFEQLTGTILFEGDPYTLNPELALQARTEKGGHEIQLVVGGTAASPTLDLRSSSNQSQVQVLQTLLGGGSGTSTLSTTEQIGELAATQAAGFASRQLTGALGVNLELVPPPVGTTQILFSVAQQITSVLWLKFYKVADAGASDIYEVRWEASERFSVEGRSTENQTQSLRLRFTRRFD